MHDIMHLSHSRCQIGRGDRISALQTSLWEYFPSRKGKFAEIRYSTHLMITEMLILRQYLILVNEIQSNGSFHGADDRLLCHRKDQ
jgi:hypothetical protein